MTDPEDPLFNGNLGRTRGLNKMGRWTGRSEQSYVKAVPQAATTSPMDVRGYTSPQTTTRPWDVRGYTLAQTTTTTTRPLTFSEIRKPNPAQTPSLSGFRGYQSPPPYPPQQQKGARLVDSQGAPLPGISASRGFFAFGSSSPLDDGFFLPLDESKPKGELNTFSQVEEEYERLLELNRYSQSQ